MRILYFTRDYTPHDHRFLAALAQTGEQVYSLRLERRGAQREDRPVPEGIEQVLWKGGRAPARAQDGPGLVQDLKRVVRQVKPDVIHAGSIQTAAFLTALAGFRPLVSMSWGSDLLKDSQRNTWWRWATRYTLARSAVLVGDCQAVRDRAVSFGFPNERIVTFPWGVDLEQFCPGPADPRLRGGEDTFVILSLRSWEPIYGVDVLVRAFARAAREVPALRLLLLGSGSQAGLIRRIIAESGVQEQVISVGQVANRDLTSYYRACDLYASASHSDGSSVSLMEALACGRPALLSDIPGNVEWIEPGKQGWLFPDGNEQALAEGMLNAYEQREQLNEMGAAARALAEDRAYWKKNFQELLRAYRMAVT